jgi:hypothetical protein
MQKTCQSLLPPQTEPFQAMTLIDSVSLASNANAPARLTAITAHAGLPRDASLCENVSATRRSAVTRGTGIPNVSARARDVFKIPNPVCQMAGRPFLHLLDPDASTASATRNNHNHTY